MKKVKAEIHRRQSEIQATMDILDAEMNLSVAEAELKVFEDEVENSRKFDNLSNFEEQDPQERTEQYVTEQQPFIAPDYPPQESLVPQIEKQVDSEQTFLKQTIDQKDSQQPTDIRLYKEQQLFSRQQYAEQQSSEQTTEQQMIQQQTSDQHPVIVSVQQPSEQFVPNSTTFLPATQLPIKHSSVHESVTSSVNLQCNTPYRPVNSNDARRYVPSMKMEHPRQQLLAQPSLVQIQSSLLPSEQQTRTRHPVSQTFMQPYSHQSSVHLIQQPQNMPFYFAQPSV